MKIAYCGPISLRMLNGLGGISYDMTAGYEYPFGACFVRALHEEGHHISVVTCDRATDRQRNIEGERISISVVPRRSTRAQILDCYRVERIALASAIKESHAEVVHAQWTYEFAAAALQSGVPQVTTIRDSPWAIFRHTRHPYRLFRALYAYRVIPKLRTLTAVSPYVAKQVSLRYRVRSPAIIVPNGLDSRLFRARDRDAAVPGYLTFATVSAWDRRKNVPALLRSFAEVRSCVPSARLVLVGSGLGDGEVGQRWARGNGLDRGVEFRGRMPYLDLLELLRTSVDVFVHTTLEESFCMAILEAMAQSVPVVGYSDAGAVPWLLDDGRAGVLVQSSSPRELTNAMKSFCKDSGPRQLGARGYQRAKKLFTMDNVVKQYLSIYKSVSS